MNTKLETAVDPIQQIAQDICDAADERGIPRDELMQKFIEALEAVRLWGELQGMDFWVAMGRVVDDKTLLQEFIKGGLSHVES